MTYPLTYQEAGPSYSSFYDTQYMYQQHQTLPSPPTSPQFSWQVTTVDEEAHTHTYNDKIPSAKARRTQVPAETMSSLMTGPDPVDGKYVCLYGGCMRRFGRKYNIQSHIQTHLADRPFRCNVCAAGFVRRHDLVRHSRIHGTGKDFICGCGKGFSRMDALNRHRQRQICVGGVGKSEGSRRKLQGGTKRSTTTSSSIDSDAGDSYRDSSETGSASPEPELYNFGHPVCISPSARGHTMNLVQPLTFQEYHPNGEDMYGKQRTPIPYTQPTMQKQQHSQGQSLMEKQRRLHDHNQKQYSHSPQVTMQTPHYVAPVPRYAINSDLTPTRRLEQEMWVNPSLISPAMTNSSQFHSEGEDGQYYY